MHSSVLLDRMPVSTSRYSSTYSSSFRPPSSSSSTSKYSTAFDLKSSSSANYRPINRRLPSGPGPLGTDGRKLSSDFSVRTRTPSKTRNGPLKADYTSDIGGYSYDTYSNRRTGVSNHDFGTSSRTLGRRSASISNLNTKDLDNLSISDTRNSRNRDYTSSYGTTPRRSSYWKDEDFLASRSSSRTSRISQSVDRESLYSPDHSRSYSRTSRNLSRDSSPVRERAPTPSRRYSTDKRGSPTSQSVSRTGSNSSISGSMSNGGKVGLRNLGNTCFMNSVIQCLSNTRPLLEYCLKEDYHVEINHTTSSMKGALMKAYVNIMQSMWKEKSDSFISPNPFKQQVQKFAPRFMGYAQQDSQEFLRYLLEGLHEDVNKVTSKPKPIVLDDDHLDRKSDQEKAAEYWRAYLNFDNSKIVDIFVGQLRSELKFSCGHSSVTFDPFWDLSLPIPKNRIDVSLDDCFRLFMKEEDLQDEPMCAKCKRRRSCTKGFSIQKFPKILVLHLKRFSQEKFGRKLSTSVGYPATDTLDLGHYAAERGGRGSVYNLYAVSNHSGSTHSGHYTAICKHPHTGEWNLFNDTRVSQARSNQAVSSEGYLLFYEQA